MAERSREIVAALLAAALISVVGVLLMRDRFSPAALDATLGATLVRKGPLRLRRRNYRAKFSRVEDGGSAEYFRTLPRKRMAAGVLLRDATGRVVLIEPSYKKTWEIPGGVVEMGEPPWTAAERELEEELGLVRRGMQALVIDHVPCADDGTPEGLVWVFDGGFLTDEERAGLHGTDPEVKSVHLLEIGEVSSLAKDSLSRRMQAALQAALDQRTNVYCEAGVPRRQEAHQGVVAMP
ncbi:NUDIX domain-containing protein [Promicromonospora citrea]|uniref:Nudix hydrolase domain-containing protein n=1 Tax=Promicromonospora citrea TaxID=43677 RepID=A0A8H9GMK9_9MICO|nr:NUDIX hydrolase [Promicromonospora citrea]GGM34363.1 hypothetical protein GCM10010102_32390 [Promicromonospora citrea]